VYGDRTLNSNATLHTWVSSMQLISSVIGQSCIFRSLPIHVLPSVLWRCWLGGRKGIRPVKKLEWWGAGVVICLQRDADVHVAQLMPLPLTVSYFSKIQIGFTFLVPAHPGSPGKGPLNGCVCAYTCSLYIVAFRNSPNKIHFCARCVCLL